MAFRYDYCLLMQAEFSKRLMKFCQASLSLKVAGNVKTSLVFYCVLYYNSTKTGYSNCVVSQAVNFYACQN